MRKSEPSKRKPTQEAEGSEDLKTITFKVPAGFHREFKMHAVSRGLSMLDLLMEGFELSKKQSHK